MLQKNVTLWSINRLILVSAVKVKVARIKLSIGMTALFLMAPAYGHLNPSFQLANQLKADGYRIVYALPRQPKLLQHVAKQGFAVSPVQSYPFGVGIDETLNTNGVESYLETLLDRFTGQNQAIRTADLQRLITELRPALILLDAFFSTDVMLLYPLLQQQPA